MSDSFCNFPKSTFWHSRPLQTMIGQLCTEEKATKVYTSLSIASFLNFYTTISVTFPVCNQMQQYECLPGVTVWKCSPLSRAWIVSIRNNYKHFWSPTWSDNMLYRLRPFQHNPSVNGTVSDDVFAVPSKCDLLFTFLRCFHLITVWPPLCSGFSLQELDGRSRVLMKIQLTWAAVE